MSPSKRGSEKKKRRREEKQNAFEESNVGSEDDIRRDESGLKGNMDGKASDSTMSPSKRESQKKKRREEKQNGSEEGNVGSEEDGIRKEESGLKGNVGGKASDSTMSPSKEESKKKKRRREEKQNSFDEIQISREDDVTKEESELNGNMDSKAPDSTMPPSKEELKRKKRRREKKQNSFDEGKIGHDDDVRREESESKGKIDCNASNSTMAPAKGKSERKKKRRDEKQNSFDEGKIGREDDISREVSESKGNIDSKAFDSTMPPSKEELKRKKRRREEEQNSFDEGKIECEDNIGREESESKGNMDSKASDSTTSPSKGKSERKKRRREEEQSGFDEGKIGREDDVSREVSESKGNMDSKAADSTMSPSKGESRRKKRRREEKQNSFDEGKIECEDNIGREGSESKGKMDSKASDLTMSPSKGESRRKKRRREEKQNDIRREESGLKGNMDGKASGSTMSPSKRESQKKKRREEMQNGSEEGNVGSEDGMRREESGLKGNMDRKASYSTMSPAKEEFKKKKRRREEKQNSFDEIKISREDDVSKEESELNGNTESKASDSTMPPSKGESKSKKTVRFQEPAKGDAYESVTDIPREKDIEDDIAFCSLDRNWKKDSVSADLRYGRFTKDEDEKIKNGVSNYIKMRGWDEEEGLQTVLHPSRRPDARGCWLEIAKCLPDRPVKQINARALRLLGGSKRGKWSPEELKELKTLQDQYGNDWKKIASFMNREAQLCKDRWRHLKLEPTRKDGTWAQDEYDELCKLVRRSLRIKASSAAKMLDRREVREDINWDSIAEEMQRDSSRCADAWYRKLVSPMVSATKWANGDDHLLLQRLLELGAASEEAVDWDTILDHRDGELCYKRWTEMTRLLGESGRVSFEGKLKLLAYRYAPHLLGIEEEV